MLKVVIPESELFDQTKGEFIQVKRQVLVMEHSLVSISKWESKWKKPYLYNLRKTREEEIDYFRCMTITQNVDPNIYKFMPINVQNQIYEYMNDPMTATVINENESGRKSSAGSIVTNELIYYWMTMFNIPFECEKWHINRLLTLIKVCEMKNRDPKKMSKADLLARQRALNEERKKKYNTKG